MKKRIQSYFALNCTVLLTSPLKVGIGPFLAIYLKSTLQWDPNQIGIALGVVNFAAMLNLIPSGLLIDEYRIKRHMLAVACLMISICGVLISLSSCFTEILLLQFFIGLAVAIIPQGIVAITLGLVGTEKFPTRESTNESLSHVGNILLALMTGYFAYFISTTWILYIYALFALTAILPISLIKGRQINHAIARQLAQSITDIKTKHKPMPIRRILRSSANGLFFIAVFLFHLSSSAQLTLLGQLFVQIVKKTDTLFMANSIIISHLVMLAVAISLRFKIKHLNRKPLFMLAFMFAFIRGILFTVSHNPYFFIALQILDGISGGIFGIISVVIIAELAVDTGRFNFMHSIMLLCQLLAYSLSNVISGYIAKFYGYNISFYVLASFAIFGFIILSLMPETFRKK